jgi:superfamily II DNA or RNA helicase
VRVEVGFAQSRVIADHETVYALRKLSASPITTYNKWSNTWDTTLAHTMELDGVFPTGLWRSVRAWGRELGHEPEVVDLRPRPGSPPDMTKISLVGMELFDFQREAVEKSLRAKNAIVKATTAAGKSAIAFATTQVVSDIRWLVVTESKKVVKQLAEEYAKLTCEKPGLCLAGAPWKIERVTFASFSQLAPKLSNPQTADATRKLLESFQGVIVDEVQCAAAATHWTVLMALTSAYYRIGLSGTPFGRSDGKHEFVIGTTGPQVMDISAPELIDMGRVASVDGTFVAFYHPPRPKALTPKQRDWEVMYRERVVNNDERNALVMRLIDIAAKPCFVFAERLSHCRAIEAALTKEKLWTTRTITGNTPEPASEEYLKGVRSGRIDVIVTNKVLNAGVSVKNLASVVIAGAGRANIPVVQRLGRAMRVDKGKDTCEYWDIADMVQLEGQTKDRARHLKREGHAVRVLEPDEFAELERQRAT